MVDYTDRATVYALIGVDSTAIPEATIDIYIDQAQTEVDQYMKTTSNPKKLINKFTGNNLTLYILKKIPLLNIQQLKISETSISIETIQYDKTGNILLDSDADERYFKSDTNTGNCIIKYEFGYLEEDVSIDAESLPSDITAQSNTISVTDADNWTVGSYVQIEGFDGNFETVKITATDTGVNTITFTTYMTHESGSTVQLMRIPKMVQDLAAVLAAIKGANYMIGNTYTFATSYQLPDYSITKGVPYPHFRDNFSNNVKQRDYYMKILSPFPVFA